MTITCIVMIIIIVSEKWIITSNELAHVQENTF